ncbi:MAG: hypothetical protein WC824_07605 [Bacteroidota bacterium]|jgi:thiosulfate/3-mercaptopyruvate sulfurtransferase
MKRFHLLLLVMPLAALLFAACSDDKTDPPDPLQPAANATTCLGCHSDEATLRKVAEPNPPVGPGEGGCGGTLPEMEAWAKVYVGGSNGEKFLNTAHGKLACVSCHGGKEPANNKLEAHGKDFVVSPSKDADKYCGNCHPSIAGRDKTSLHTQGFGQKAMVAKRGNFPSYENYPEQLKKGYDKNCGKCHASCGECHVMRPRQASGGFLASHLFKKKPDMALNCTACHSARVAHAYFGEAAGSRPDVHFLKLSGGECTNCHSADEMHGTGAMYTQRYSVANQPKCEKCHADKAKANNYHSMHWDTMSCQSCHSQDYQNCGSCHVDTGVRNGPYMSFKIGMNPMPNVKRFKYAVLRNAPHAPDTWSNYGIPSLANFAAEPTWRYATPHNIKRWTPRTEVQSGQSCSAACHIKDGANAQWFLFSSDLGETWEKTANANVVVDGKLPAGWK